MAKESSQGQARSAPPLGCRRKVPSPGGATDIDCRDLSNRHRAPRGARSNLSRQLPGAARWALAPGYSLPRLRRCCRFPSEEPVFPVGSAGCCGPPIDTSGDQLTIRPAKAGEFQCKHQLAAASGSKAKKLKQLNKPTGEHASRVKVRP